MASISLRISLLQILVLLADVSLLQILVILAYTGT